MNKELEQKIEENFEAWFGDQYTESANLEDLRACDHLAKIKPLLFETFKAASLPLMKKINELESQVHDYAKYILEEDERNERLEKQLDEANELLIFYSRGGNPSTDVWKHEGLGYFTGKQAREYIKKFGVEG